MNCLRFLMCPPRHFGVEYVINPWMEGQIHATNPDLAGTQWSRLHALMSEHAEVASLPAVAGLPDLVFTANAALIYRRKAVLSSFRHLERQPESPHFAKWLTADGSRFMLFRQVCCLRVQVTLCSTATSYCCGSGMACGLI
jgi:N-dimethylarginine dimethylaminohydrolase